MTVKEPHYWCAYWNGQCKAIINAEFASFDELVQLLRDGADKIERLPLEQAREELAL